MSRFSRTHSVHSRPRIEYSPDVLRDVCFESTIGEATGLLFGTSRGGRVHIVAARRVDDHKDPRLDGLEPVGIFIARAREDLSLCEADLARFENARTWGSVVLVVAGTSGAFFLREPDGSIRRIEALTARDPSAAAEKKPLFPMPSARRWAWLGLGCITLATVAVAAPAYFRPRLLASNLGLTMREEAGQLRIAWNRGVMGEKGRLDIIDGGDRTSIPVSLTLANATYMHRTSDVEIRLTKPSGSGEPIRETARFLRNEVPPQLTAGEIRKQVASLEAEARNLRAMVETRRRWVAELRKITDRLSRFPTPLTPP